MGGWRAQVEAIGGYFSGFRPWLALRGSAWRWIWPYRTVSGREPGEWVIGIGVLGLGHHEVLVASRGSGGARGSDVRSKVSMMIMRPPQRGQGWERLGG